MSYFCDSGTVKAPIVKQWWQQWQQWLNQAMWLTDCVFNAVLSFCSSNTIWLLCWIVCVVLSIHISNAILLPCWGVFAVRILFGCCVGFCEMSRCFASQMLFGCSIGMYFPLKYYLVVRLGCVRDLLLVLILVTERLFGCHVGLCERSIFLSWERAFSHIYPALS